MINVGFGNYVPEIVVTALVSSDSAPIKRKIDDARKNGMVIDITCGRKTRSALFINNGSIVLSAIQTDTIAKRFDREVNTE